MKEVIIANNLKKSFNGSNTLDGLSFTLRYNENLVLLGRSGGGKSVLLKTIIGLLEPDSGSLEVLGKDVLTIREKELIGLRKKVGYLFQDGALYDSMNVNENVSFFLKRQIKKKTSGEIRKLVEDALDRVGLLKAINKMPDELSGGMKKRVALARILVMEPEIILYDEPTAGLDSVTSKEIIELILNMKLEYGISSITATHDLVCSKLIADRMMILHEGKIGAIGTYDELGNSDVPWISAFFQYNI